MLAIWFVFVDLMAIGAKVITLKQPHGFHLINRSSEGEQNRSRWMHLIDDVKCQEPKGPKNALEWRDQNNGLRQHCMQIV